MTPRQAQLLNYLTACEMASDVTPTQDQMAAALGLKSKSRIAGLLDALERHGKIIWLPRSARSASVVGIDDYRRGYRDGVADTQRQRSVA